MIAKSKPLDTERIEDKIIELCKIHSKTSNFDVVAKIKNIIPEYISNNSKYEVLDQSNN